MSNQHKVGIKTWQRLAFGSLLCASLSHCAGVDTGESDAPIADLPGQNQDSDDSAALPGNPDVHAASSVIKAPSGTDLKKVHRWFVELEGVPLVEGGDLGALDEGLDRFRKEAFDSGLKVREHMRFDGIIHGITVSVDSRELGKLSTLRGVKAVYPVGITKMPKLTRPAVPALKSAIVMTGADVVQNDLGFDGTGVRVGIIDSGIDVDHPDFHVGGTLAGASRIDLTRSHDFVGDDYNANDPEHDEPVPDNNPDDCGGHGTHVAGIIGASGKPATGAVGVAPGVTLQSYRVFGCDGSVSNDIITAAIERAYEDGAQVINLSLGSASGWSEDFYAVALSRVLALGVVPVAAQGNEGDNGPWSAGAPGVGEDVIAVASVNNSKEQWRSLKLSTNDVVRYSVLQGSPDSPDSGSVGPVVYVGQGCPANDEEGVTEDPYIADPSGKVALITRGTCTFAAKYERARDAGATFVVIEQSEARADEAPSGAFLTDDPAFDAPFPAIFIGREDGTKLKGLITANGDTTLTFQPGYIQVDAPEGGLITGFSSWGLTNELNLKPDIAAPGGNIRSTWPLSRTDGQTPGYNTISGTSMASPHVAGAVALLLEAQPSLPVTRVRTILQNSAQQVLVDKTDDSVLDGAHHQGAGLLRIDLAIQAKTVVTPAKIEPGEGEAGPFMAQLYVENLSDQDATYTLGTLDHALASWGYAFDDNGVAYTPYPNRVPAHAKVEFQAGGSLEKITTLTVPAHKVRTLAVTITAPTHSDEWGDAPSEELPDGAVYSGFISLTPEAGSHATKVTVPYAGVVGDYQAIDPLDYPAYGLDAPLVMLNDASLAESADLLFSDVNVAEPYHVYSMKEGDVPAAAMRFSHGVQKLTTYFVPHGDTAWLGAFKSGEITYLPRNYVQDSYLVTPFTLSDYGAGKLPDGVYHLRVKVLKALGNPKNPSDLITLDSEPFRIDRTAEPPAPPDDEGP